MTRAEYEAHCHEQGLDPDFPIQEWRRYKVTGWHTEKPLKVMYAYTNEITADKVTAQITTDDYRFPSTSTWTRTMADRWTWTEVTI
jgi:hypothetical protein